MRDCERKRAAERASGPILYRFQGSPLKERLYLDNCIGQRTRKRDQNRVAILEEIRDFLTVKDDVSLEF